VHNESRLNSRPPDVPLRAIGHATSSRIPESEVPEHEPVPNSVSDDNNNKGKVRNGSSSTRILSGTGFTLGRSKGRSSLGNINGKGKGKAVSTGGDDSDSSFDGFQHTANGNSLHGNAGFEEDEDRIRDGAADADRDDYIVRTNRLK
jgi:hypothetical protein